MELRTTGGLAGEGTAVAAGADAVFNDGTPLGRTVLEVSSECASTAVVLPERPLGSWPRRGSPACGSAPTAVASIGVCVSSSFSVETAQYVEEGCRVGGARGEVCSGRPRSGFSLSVASPPAALGVELKSSSR